MVDLVDELDSIEAEPPDLEELELRESIAVALSVASGWKALVFRWENESNSCRGKLCWLCTGE